MKACTYYHPPCTCRQIIYLFCTSLFLPLSPNLPPSHPVPTSSPPLLSRPLPLPLPFPPSTGFGRFSTFDELNTRNQIALKRILDDKKDDDVEAVRKVKALYTSCMDTDTIDNLGAQPLLDLINATGKNWLS